MAAATALASCWMLESFVPAVRAAAVGSTRYRHLFLAALNAVPAIGIAAGLTVLDSAASARGLGLLKSGDAPAWHAAIAAFVVLDLCQYAGHVLMHKSPLLWRLHAVHHHAEQVESTTAFRFHTLEIVVQGLLLIPPMMLFGVRVNDIALYNAILLPMSMFHHANVRLPPRLERALGLVVVTPGLHRLHHARWQPLTDSNYSAVLSIWDRIFRTASAHPHPELIPVGLDGFDPEHTNSLRGMLGTPFSSARAGPGSPPRRETSCDEIRLPTPEKWPRPCNGSRPHRV